MRRPCTKPGPDHTPPARGRAQARSRGAHLGLEQHARLLQPRRAGRAGGGGRRERRRRGRGRAGASREGSQRGGQRRGEQQRAEHALCIMTRARGMCKVAKRRAQRAPTRHATPRGDATPRGSHHAAPAPPSRASVKGRGARAARCCGAAPAGRQAGRQAALRRRQVTTSTPRVWVADAVLDRRQFQSAMGPTGLHSHSPERGTRLCPRRRATKQAEHARWAVVCMSSCALPRRRAQLSTGARRASSCT